MRKVIGALILGTLLSSSFSYAAGVSLQRLLTTTGNDSGGRITITVSGGATDTHIRQVGVRFGDVGCTGFFAPTFITEPPENPGFVFTSGQTVSLNSQSLFLLVIDSGIDPNAVGCMETTMNNGVFPSGTQGFPSPVQFSDETCSLDTQTCTSNQTQTSLWDFQGPKKGKI